MTIYSPSSWHLLGGNSFVGYTQAFLMSSSCSTASLPTKVPALHHLPGPQSGLSCWFPRICWKGLLLWNHVITWTFELLSEPDYSSKTETRTFPSVPLVVPNPQLRNQLDSINDYWLRGDVMGFLNWLGLYISCCGDKRFSHLPFLTRIELRLLSTQAQSHEGCGKTVT